MFFLFEAFNKIFCLLSVLCPIHIGGGGRFVNFYPVLCHSIGQIIIRVTGRFFLRQFAPGCFAPKTFRLMDVFNDSCLFS